MPDGDWTFEWTAPAAGSGDITFYVAGLAINGNGSTNGDETATAMLTVSEKIESSTTQLDRDFAAMTIAPNPIEDWAKLAITSELSGQFQLRIADITGKIVFAENINLQVGQNEKNLNLSNLQGGLYILQLEGDKHLAVEQLIKL